MVAVIMKCIERFIVLGVSSIEYQISNINNFNCNTTQRNAFHPHMG